MLLVNNNIDMPGDYLEIADKMLGKTCDSNDRARCGGIRGIPWKGCSV